MTNARKRELWAARVADYRASDLSVRQWCEANGVTNNALRYWLSKMGQQESDIGGAGSRAAWARLEIVGEGGQAGDAADEACAGEPTLSVRAGHIRARRVFHRCFGISGAHRPLRQPIPICSGLGFHTGAI